MIKQISWAECFTFLTVGLIIYYTVVAFIFYRVEFYAILKGEYKPSKHAVSYSHEATTSATVENGLYNQVLELMQDCKQVFQEAVDHSLEKSQVVESLQLRLKKYPQIIGTAFQVAVVNHIDQELQTRCGLSLSESDIKILWG
jgi:hypothetical protein